MLDCFFVCFTEYPGWVDIEASISREYKHHYTSKVLVGIIPIGTISYICVVSKFFSFFRLLVAQIDYNPAWTFGAVAR